MIGRLGDAGNVGDFPGGAGGDEELTSREVTAIDTDFIWAQEVSGASEGADALLLVVAAIASRTSAFDDGVAPEKDGRVVVADRGGAQAKRSGSLGGVVDVGDIEQGTKRYFAPVGGLATKFVLFDDSDFLASTSGDRRGRTATCAAADDDDVVVKCWFLCHVVSYNTVNCCLYRYAASG